METSTPHSSKKLNKRKNVEADPETKREDELKLGI
jgi:hypothetical protein